MSPLPNQAVVRSRQTFQLSSHSAWDSSNVGKPGGISRCTWVAVCSLRRSHPAVKLDGNDHADPIGGEGGNALGMSQ